ncbi:IucA/IucC family C-terminal-domain containing protein [Alkalihalobacillus pseudalcaliphilus]|uniref:IucA/IucC family C-terminal-domain containing protein n=1 Tax=Alkalihalobacillus pseudalcaliphilus TaxID=79884 RepID=UPI0023613CF4|nr:IucA/IucC family C-terminal-domain containing protein [Alkalihalobacillus pseudalcaliphilus]
MSEIKEALNDTPIKLINGGESDGLLISDLFSDDKCSAFLEEQQITQGSPSKLVASSMFSKRYAFLVLTASTHVCLNLKGCIYWNQQASYYTTDKNLALISENVGLVREPEFEACMDLYLEKTFQENLTPILNQLHATTRLPLKILWENVAVRINSIFRKIVKKVDDEIERDRIIAVFNQIKYAEPRYFALEKNPLTPYLQLDGEKRKTCCMYYKLERCLETGEYCLVCPLKK